MAGCAGVAILGCQTTVGQRFEHLAAKTDWREPQECFEVAGLRIPCDQGVGRNETSGAKLVKGLVSGGCGAKNKVGSMVTDFLRGTGTSGLAFVVRLP